jgi:predicted nicotinamide N-methyase
VTNSTPPNPAGDDLRLSRLEFLPELRLYLFDPSMGLFDPAEGEYRSDRPPPFWGFAWAGGQALARYLLDQPEVVGDCRVLDLACGSGLVAVAAAKAGAAQVVAVDVDPGALVAVRDNARANGVWVEAVASDILSEPVPDVDVVLAGDAFYSKAMADRVDGFLRRASRTGARVLVGDPDRGYLKSPYLQPMATYDIPVSSAVEGVSSQRTTVFELRAAAPRKLVEP